MIQINYNEVKADLEKKNLYDIQKDLTQSRRARTAVMTLLLISLLATIAYGMLEDPIINTLSNTGNFYTHRLYFIIWSIITGLSIQFTVVALFKLEKYVTKYGFYFIGISAALLVITAFVPALRDDYPTLHVIHTITSVLHALFLYLALVPFSLWVSKENPRLRTAIIIWQIVIWVGSIVMVILFRHSALFELWYFVTCIIFLLYLSLTLFEEAIIKKSVKLLTDEENLNIAIEKIFVNLDSMTEKGKKEDAKVKA